MAVKTTIHLDERILERSRRYIDGRGLSRFGNQAMAEKLATLERKELEEELREGYIASRTEHADVDDDWRAIEVEGWPE